MHRLSVDAATPLQSRSFDAVVTETQSQQQSVGNSELNLHSLSSDSGLHTEKTSEMSSGDFNSKVEDERSSPTAAVVEVEGDKDSPASCDSNKPTPVRLSRVGSVKSRVNIFQHLENKQNTTEAPNAAAPDTKRPTPKKCKRYVYIVICELTVAPRCLPGRVWCGLRDANRILFSVSVNKFEAQLLAATKRREAWNQSKESPLSEYI